MDLITNRGAGQPNATISGFGSLVVAPAATFAEPAAAYRSCLATFSTPELGSRRAWAATAGTTAGMDVDVMDFYAQGIAKHDPTRSGPGFCSPPV